MSKAYENTLIDEARKRSVISNLMIDGASQAIDFYKQVFDATEIYRLEYDNKIVHAEILIGNTTFMIAEKMSKMENAETTGNRRPTKHCLADPVKSWMDASITFYAYVDDVDYTFNKAVEFGAKVLYPIQIQFYGDKMGAIQDPFGFNWSIAKHVKDVSLEKINQMMPELIKGMYPSSESKHADLNLNDLNQKKYYKYKQKYMQLRERQKQKN